MLIDAGLPPSALSPEFEMSASAIHSVYREFSSTTQILLVESGAANHRIRENAGASASRGDPRVGQMPVSHYWLQPMSVESWTHEVQSERLLETREEG